MINLPIDVINLICQFAASHDKIWYPQFSPKTHRLKWKVNKFCKKINDLIQKKYALKQIRGTVTLSITNEDIYITNFNANVFGALWYITFDSENEKNKQDKHIYYTSLIYKERNDFRPVLDEYIFKNNRNLYLNGTIYAYLSEMPYYDDINRELTLFASRF